VGETREVTLPHEVSLNGLSAKLEATCAVKGRYDEYDGILSVMFGLDLKIRPGERQCANLLVSSEYLF
jgi:hypothetical protein